MEGKDLFRKTLEKIVLLGPYEEMFCSGDWYNFLPENMLSERGKSLRVYFSERE